MHKKAKALLTALALVPATATSIQAQSGVEIAVGVGAGLLFNEWMKTQSQSSSRPRSGSQQNNVEREQRREIQRRLNQLGFNAGTPDGIFGSRTRAAISAYQATIGTVPTGELTEAQIIHLYQLTTPGAVVTPAPGMANAPQFPATGVPGAMQPPAPQFPSVGGAPAGQPGAPTFPAVGGGAAAPSGGAQFPSIGGTPANGQPAGPQFPTVGGAPNAGPATGSQFPAVGGEGQAAPAGGPQFPAVTGNGEGVAPPMFPAVGGEGAGAPSAGPAFPTVSGPDATAASNTAFPALGAPGGAGAPSFPELATPEVSEEAAAFPTIDAPTDVIAPPTIAVPSWLETLYTRKDASEYDLDALIATTVYETRDKQPKIFGIALDSDFAEAVSILQEREFVGCEDSSAEVVSCSKDDDVFRQTVTVAQTDDGKVWAIERDVHFHTALSREAALDTLRAPYPELVETGGIANAFCEPRGLSNLEVIDYRSFTSELWTEQQTSFEAFDCPLVYEVKFSESGGLVNSFKLRFFHLSPHVLPMLTALEDQRVSEQDYATQVTKKLDF